jgi:hypothetical protein
MERDKFFNTNLLLKDLRKHEKVYIWYVAVEGAKMGVVLG